MNIQDLSKAAWDQAVDKGENPYTKAISPEQVAAEKAGHWTLYLSDCKAVPQEWFPTFAGMKVLCLASGGGQQALIFAALGAEVTLLDASAEQLAQDKHVAERDGLLIRIIEGDMADLSAFASNSFDLIFNPPSTLFVPDLKPVWQDCHRVLKAGGSLMTGFLNPDEFIFDVDVLDNKGALSAKEERCWGWLCLR